MTNRYRLGAVLHLQDVIGNGATESVRVVGQSFEYHHAYGEDITLIAVRPIRGEDEDVYSLSLNELDRLTRGE